MAFGDIVYQVTYQPGTYSLMVDPSGYHRIETLGGQAGVDVREFSTSMPAASKNRIFDSTKSYKVTITEA